MRLEGLEPPLLAELEPKSSVSTNFTTGALARVCIYENGAGRETRTPDLMITNQLRYQLCHASILNGMVLMERLELPTCRLQIGCSTN